MSPHHAYPLSVSEQDYLDGEVYAIAGAKAAHNHIVSNVFSLSYAFQRKILQFYDVRYESQN
ncbi:hypothetical protein QLH32_03535 [Acinetobacter corruptisaponis]|uniref:Restriction endonuclease domain-containing protein n=1 Tax=Acinetobacter corruptisaponis TaxID=3045147 RepID=A0ABY8S8A6_9GAMM|nr:hypothetical protein [Acinetobacter sp. KCTC 92772]WHP07721.1 hypothetical protein QLH32_03535 [Acinetobacter sp. KCTC 92772]